MLDYLYGKLQSDDKYRIDLSPNQKHPAFQYNRERVLAVSKIFGHKGFFLFSSRNSYDKFKQSKFNFSPLQPEGVGIPLFQIKRSNEILGNISGNAPVYVIYKYIILPHAELPPFTQYEVVLNENGMILYKIPYCEIYIRAGIPNIELELIFDFDGNEKRHLFMVRRTYNRDLFTVINNTNLRWHVPFSPVNDGDYRLAILENNFPSLLDDRETRKRKKKAVSQKKESRVIGHLTRKQRDILPKTISKEATISIGEWSDSPSYGISSIPWETQALSCQALLIHYLEYERREKDNRRRRHRGDQMDQTTLLNNQNFMNSQNLMNNQNFM